MKSKLPQTVASAVLSLAAAGAASAQARDELGIATAKISLIDAGALSAPSHPVCAPSSSTQTAAKRGEK